MINIGLCRVLIVSTLGLFSACSSTPEQLGSEQHFEPAKSRADLLLLLNRITWGANTTSASALEREGTNRYLDRQLQPGPYPLLPPEVQSQIDAMTISRQRAGPLAIELEQRRKDADKIVDVEQKKAALQAYQEDLNRLGREAAARTLLRALYSPQQLREQMTWFWMNHFNIHLYKANIRALIGDFEERAIRPQVLGRFRDLLGSTVHHPAMLRYLDNEQNASGHINENYARELLELHTLGVNGGYTQGDVQELARILTGFGVNIGTDTPNVRPVLRAQYLRDGLFEFNPNRHDYGEKILLGRKIDGRGALELEEALDRLARHPATARFICRKLAVFLVADDPPVTLVEVMSRTFLSTDGDITATLRTMFSSQEFKRSLGGKFKDPIHYVVSAVRLAYDEKVILNVGPMINWLNRMGEPIYGRQTPDGYPLTRTEWASAGQLATRFEIAKAIGYGSAGLFKGEGPSGMERAAFPQLSNPLYFEFLHGLLGAPTRQALDRATSPQEWNMLLLASPEFMNR